MLSGIREDIVRFLSKVIGRHDMEKLDSNNGCEVDYLCMVFLWMCKRRLDRHV
jgi:hypothetical protein